MPLDPSLKRKSKKDGLEVVGKVSTPKADMLVEDLYVAGFRAHDNHGNKYSTNKYSLLGLPPTLTLYSVAVCTIFNVLNFLSNLILNNDPKISMNKNIN